MTDAPTLFDRQHLERVRSRIGTAIVQFCRAHRTFHADDLRRHVEREVGTISPASADRILRDLRKRGVIAYTVVDRRRSLYAVQEVA